MYLLIKYKYIKYCEVYCKVTHTLFFCTDNLTFEGNITFKNIKSLQYMHKNTISVDKK